MSDRFFLLSTGFDHLIILWVVVYIVVIGRNAFSIDFGYINTAKIMVITNNKKTKNMYKAKL